MEIPPRLACALIGTLWALLNSYIGGQFSWGVTPAQQAWPTCVDGFAEGHVVWPVKVYWIGGRLTARGFGMARVAFRAVGPRRTLSRRRP